MDTQCSLMLTSDGVVVECRHYDASDYAGYRTIYYERPWHELVLLPTSRLCFDQSGKLEDLLAHAEEFVTLEQSSKGPNQTLQGDGPPAARRGVAACRTISADAEGRRRRPAP